MKKAILCITCLLLVMGTSVYASNVECRYEVTDLGDIEWAFSINSSNQIGGHLNSNFPAIWDNGSVVRMKPLSQPGYAYDINSSGMVVGTSNSKAVTWDSSGNVTYLPVPSGTYSSEATVINDYGVVGGHILGSSVLLHACYWVNGSRIDLGVPYGHQSTVRGLNNNGDIVVDSWLSSGEYHTYIYSNGQFSPLISDLTNIDSSYAACINDAGMVVGSVFKSDGTQQAYLWKNGITTLLPNPTGKDNPRARAVNNAGIVVGEAWQSGGYPNSLACIWDGQKVSYLNDLIPANSGWTLEYTRDINDLGQIVGSGTLNGVTRGFLLTPVPEPSSVTTLIFGAVYACSLLRRRQKKGRL